MRRHWWIPVVAVVAVVGLIVTVASGLAVGAGISRALLGGRTASAPTTEGALTWHDCAGSDSVVLSRAGARCATVTVPMDWAHPHDGKTVRLAISRVQHTGQYLGVMLANPGGPGASGLTLSTLGARVPNRVGDRYDWIGFDPRGIGDSRPKLTCDLSYAAGPRPQYTPATGQSIHSWLERSADYADACKKNGELLANMKTTDLAKDMDAIRRALGVDTINYFGYSYGTYLGQVYATLFPTHLKRMVLDSTVDPAGVWYQANFDQDVAFQTALEHWFVWIARHHATYGLGTTAAAVQRRYLAEQAALGKDPQGELGSAEWADTFLYAGYSQSLWPDLADAFQSATEGKYLQAVGWYESFNPTHDDNGYVGYLATECTDASWPKDWATWEADTRRVDRTAPLGTWLNTWFNAPCRTWPAASGTPTTIDGSKTGPILMIDETLDAATPFAGSLAVRKLFPKASLLAEPGGTSHADSLSGNACVDDAIRDYLSDGTLPTRKAGNAPDSTCAPLPEPSP